MTEAQLYEAAYNAHERAESAALAALRAKLEEQSIEALACLADPRWRWETRGSLSAWITDYAGDVLNEKLDSAVAATMLEP